MPRKKTNMAKTITNLYKQLLADCAEAETNITEVCRELGIDRTAIQDWRAKTPKTIQTLERIQAKIKEKRERITNPTPQQ